MLLWAFLWVFGLPVLPLPLPPLPGLLFAPSLSSLLRLLPSALGRLACFPSAVPGALPPPLLCWPPAAPPLSLGPCRSCRVIPLPSPEPFLWFSSRSLAPGARSGLAWWGCPVVSPVVSAVRFVALSAFRAGRLASLSVGPSGVGAGPAAGSASPGSVLACGFSCPVRAGAFAARWSARCGCALPVRCAAGLWVVRVPVSLPGRCVAVAGVPVAGLGLAGVLRAAALFSRCGPPRVFLACGGWFRVVARG